MIIKLLCKEINISYLSVPLKIINRTIIYSFMISYIIWNLIILINPNPNPSNLLETGGIESYNRVNILTEQNYVFWSFTNFIQDAAKLDFGYIEGGYDDRFSIIFDKLLNTILFLSCGLITSVVLSILLLMINSKLKYDYTNNINLLNLSYLHIFLIFFIIDKIVKYDLNALPFYLLLFLSSLIVSIGSGILADFYLLLKEEYQNIMNKDYVIFAKDSGFSQHMFAFKELILNLITISISRIPIIFGGLIIIEYRLSDSGLGGISHFILDKIKSGDNMSLYVSVMFCILFFSFLYFISEFIQSEIIKR